MDSNKPDLAKSLVSLKDKAAALPRIDVKALGAKAKAGLSRIDLTRVRETAARMKESGAKLADLRRPDAAAALERLKAAKDSLARGAQQAREQMPRALGDVVPKARQWADRIVEAVPRRAPAPTAADAQDPALDPIADAAPVTDTRPVDRPRVGPQVTTDTRTTAQRPILLRMLPLLLAMFAGGIVHIVATFAAPFFSPGSAWKRLSVLAATPNRMLLLPAVGPNAMPLPFLTPDMRYALCRYDLALGAVQVDVVLPDPGWSLALYTPHSDNFYAVPAQQQRSTELSFQIVAASDRLIQLAPGVRRADVNLTQVTSPTREGLVVIRAPVRGVAYQAEAERILRGASCRQTRTN